MPRTLTSRIDHPSAWRGAQQADKQPSGEGALLERMIATSS